MGTRWWTVEEANAALPRVGAAVESARRAAQGIATAVREASDQATGNGHSEDRGARTDLAAVVESLAEESIVLRDVGRGLVDFPARSPSGRPYWLCWVVGEPTVAWWHWPEDGFAGRTRLTEPPA
jgi:hypothetical protein